MVICLLVLTFFTVVATGPDGAALVERRREHADRPLARVVYLPSAACRPDAIVGRCAHTVCAICRPST